MNFSLQSYSSYIELEPWESPEDDKKLSLSSTEIDSFERSLSTENLSLIKKAEIIEKLMYSYVYGRGTSQNFDRAIELDCMSRGLLSNSYVWRYNFPSHIIRLAEDFIETGNVSLSKHIANSLSYHSKMYNFEYHHDFLWINIGKFYEKNNCFDDAFYAYMKVPDMSFEEETLDSLIDLCMHFEDKKISAHFNLSGLQFKIDEISTYILKQEYYGFMSQYKLATLYYSRPDVENNYRKALSLYKGAVKAEGLDDQDIFLKSHSSRMIGILYLCKFNNIKQNFHKAWRWFQFSSNLGNKEARNELKKMRGKGVLPSYNKSFDEYKKMAKKGKISAQYRLGYLYYFGDGKQIQIDYNKAFKWLKKAAKQGDFIAQGIVGDCYYYERGCSQDHAKAVKWYEKAAEKGNSAAQNMLGLFYEVGSGKEKDPMEFYKKASKSWNMLGQYNLGRCYQKGKFISQDYIEAFKWFERSASQGLDLAQNSLGCCYRDAQGVSQNYAEAIKYFEKAADQGNGDAQCNLACLHYRGEGIPKDFEKALEYFKKAAEKGNISALGHLGFFYKNGILVEKDLSKAVKYYEKASEKGDNFSKNELGFIYHEGYIVQNYDKSKKYFQEVAKAFF